MKRFLRTIGGKAVLFTGCIISLTIFVVSLCTAIYMIETGFYTKNEDSIYVRMIERELGIKGISFLQEVSVSKQEPVIYQGGSMAFAFMDDSGNIILETPDAKEVDSWPYAGYFLVQKYTASDEDKYRSFQFWYADTYSAVPEPVSYDDTDNNFVLFTLKAAEALDPAGSDVFSFFKKLEHVLYSLKVYIWIIAVLALGLTLTCFISLMCVSGRRNDTEELVPGLLNRVPFDIMLAAGGLLILFPIYLMLRNTNTSEVWTVVLMAGVFLLAANILLGLCMSAAARLKTKTLARNTVIFRILELLAKGLTAVGHGLEKVFLFIGKMIRDLPLVVKTIIAIVVLSLIELFAIIAAINSRRDDGLMIFWTLEKVILVPLILYAAIMLKRLKKSGEILAAGNLSHQTDLTGMTGDFKRHGEDLNRIAEGMNLAVEEKMKSERMKTELITNVSHDIKTPLTSVINYADLISREETDNEKIREYSEVLKRQSDRLKRLIEDLVEASKASSGVLDIDPEALNVGVLLQQAAGEYEEKIKSAGLELILSIPEEDTIILADSRRMWRIFDNLLNNTAKYAQPGTRVYLTLERDKDRAVISLKNISRDPLNISEEELMERFTRGDASRHTEGSGLGLSIAKSLAELQGGKLHVKIDGDLFKAVLEIPLLQKTF